MSVLEIDDLSVSFRTGNGLVKAVRNVSLTVDAGQTLAIVGESGSGKSTTASAINKLLAENAVVESGRVLLDGADLTDRNESQMRVLRGAAIGLVPQDPMSNLNPVMRIGDQIAEALQVHGKPAGQAQVTELLELVGIPDPQRRSRQYPHEFSGGMRQRVLIAIGLACRPRLLIADEPTSALDVTVQRRILDQLDELTDELGTAVVLVTHDLALAAERADTIAVMYRGEVVESGSASEVLGSPKHEYTKRLLAASPAITTARARGGEATTPTEPGAPLLEVSGLTKVFGVRRGWQVEEFVAVDDASLTVPRGATVSIVGESGSGKSTLANMVLGLLEPTAGQIIFDGSPVAGAKAATDRRSQLAFRKRVQPVFQNPFASLDPRYTVERSIAEPLRVHGLHREGRNLGGRVRELLDQVALPANLASRRPHELSGGQRQRVAIARALALTPDLVVLDEAVSALDVLVQAQILDLLDSLQDELGLSYLFISHDLAVVRMISDHVHVMRRGRIVETGTPDEIFDHPEHEYTRELLSAIPGRTRG